MERLLVAHFNILQQKNHLLVLLSLLLSFKPNQWTIALFQKTQRLIDCTPWDVRLAFLRCSINLYNQNQLLIDFISTKWKNITHQLSALLLLLNHNNILCDLHLYMKWRQTRANYIFIWKYLPNKFSGSAKKFKLRLIEVDVRVEKPFCAT